MENMSLMDIIKINPVIILILIGCSVLIVFALLERMLAFARIGGLNSGVAERIKQYIRQGQVKEAIAVASKSDNFASHALEVALNAASLPREEMESIFALYRMKLQGLLNKRLSVFGTLAFIGPLIGLLGTVLGVIRAFKDLALSGSGGPSIVAAGIAEALITTAGGIGVAVVAAVFYNIFTALVRGRVQEFDQLSQEIAILVYAGGDKRR